jgi:hypothetical protein
MIDSELEVPKNELDQEMESTETKNDDVEQTQEVDSKLDQELENLAKEEFGDENQELNADFINSSKELINEVVGDDDLSSEDIKDLINSSKEELLENFDNELSQQKEEIEEETKEEVKALKNELDEDFEDEEELKTRSR